jgi:hypothetical protein
MERCFTGMIPHDLSHPANYFNSTREVYQMMWQLNDLTDFIIAGARYGGPLGERVSSMSAYI